MSVKLLFFNSRAYGSYQYYTRPKVQIDSLPNPSSSSPTDPTAPYKMMVLEQTDKPNKGSVMNFSNSNEAVERLTKMISRQQVRNKQPIGQTSKA